MTHRRNPLRGEWLAGGKWGKGNSGLLFLLACCTCFVDQWKTCFQFCQFAICQPE